MLDFFALFIIFTINHKKLSTLYHFLNHARRLDSQIKRNFPFLKVFTAPKTFFKFVTVMNDHGLVVKT